jgi:penicillin-binding protein 2
MTWFHPHNVTRRADAGRLVVALLFGVLLVGFFRIQVIGRYDYKLQSDGNRLRPVPLPAPRGLIVDRNGVVLADNVPTLHGLTQVPGLDSARIEAIVRRFRRFPHEPAVVMRDAPFNLVSALEESRVTIPRLHIQAEPKRRYPRGEIVAHVLGYVGEITESELTSGQIRGARSGSIVGRDGLERQYDDQLRGTDGRRTFEVTALGRTVIEVREEAGLIDPTQGDTLHTTLDVELQTYIDSVFPPGFSGGVVAMDPRSGAVLAHGSASLERAFAGRGPTPVQPSN